MTIKELTPDELKEVAAFFKNKAVRQGYNILINEGIEGFSKNFDIQKLIKKLLVHFEKTEEYEKCNEILSIYEKSTIDRLLKN
tara:strand:+ start:809 stop:1057 length:249 start_codon:yes stop_codon:yes gene_type:complete